MTELVPLRARGFTLIEMIIAMVITGIVAAIAGVFMVSPIRAYIDSARRAEMSDVADTALRRLGFEIRQAVPNSLRVSANSRVVEFVPAIGGGVYRAQRNNVACAVAGNADPIFNADDCTVADNDSFDVLGPSVSAQVGDFVVIGNTGQPDLDVYEGSAGGNRRALRSVAGAKVQFEPGAVFPRFESPSQRFQLVAASGPRAFVCVDAGGGRFDLRRYDAYVTAANWGNAPPASFAGSGALLASGLTTCAFDYQAVSAANGLLLVRLTIRREDEEVTLVHQIHVDNLP